MTKRFDNSTRRANRLLSRVHRAIVPIRQSGGASIISIPKSIRQAVEIEIGDRVLIEYNPETQKIELTKDSQGSRDRALYQVKNLETIGNLIRDAHEADNRDRWETKIESALWGLLNHLKGEKLDKRDNDDDSEDE